MSVFSALYHKFFVKRYDDDHIVTHFSYKSFPGMQASDLEFKTPQGNTIRGHIYSFPDHDRKDLVVFSHGLGAGHRAYMREIQTLCRHGYEVLAYDNTGCWESDGKDISGVSESINCLVSCLDYIASDKDLKGRGLHIIGHSWGGYAAGNILSYRSSNIKSVTVISGFASIEIFTEAGYAGKLKMFRRNIMRFEKKANPAYAESCSADALRSTPVKCLLLHSTDDQMADIGTGLEYVRSRISNPAVSYYVTEGKFHNPNYTTDAVTYMMQVFGEYQNLVSKRKLRSFEQKKAYFADKDFLRMTVQDPEVWDVIFKHMESAE